MSEERDMTIVQKDGKLKNFRHRHRNEIKAYSLLGFPLAWWTLFFVVAFVTMLIFSFTDVSLSKLASGSKISFTLDNYRRMFDFSLGTKFDNEFWESLWVTVKWMLVMTVGNNVMALLCAFLISSLKRGRRFFLGLLFWPSLVSAVVGSDVTKLVFSSESSGLANKILMAFGHDPINWLTDEQFALISLMIMPFFLGFCTKMLIYYSSIISIPSSYQEAAVLDTNSRFKIFFKITLPLMKNAIILNVLLSVIDGFKILGPMQLITQGGYGTESSMLYIYNTAFEDGAIGRACAYATVLFLIILVFTLIQRKFSGKEVEDVE
ncbi:MAG: sugar ABC transporter permease [Clostridia bacterium]|nr:sugar ABC transporter permease [Clostridia bacterium]